MAQQEEEDGGGLSSDADEITPTTTDVFLTNCNRKDSKSQMGNIYLSHLVVHHRRTYQNLDPVNRTGKRKISAMLCEKIVSNNGRFLKQELNGAWRVASIKEAQDSICMKLKRSNASKASAKILPHSFNNTNLQGKRRPPLQHPMVQQLDTREPSV